jgi:hypothetical protein
MARAKSVVMTPADGKKALAEAKDAVKVAKSAHTSAAKDRAAIDKAHLSRLKAMKKLHDSEVSAAVKTYTEDVKASNKVLSATAKDLTIAETAMARLLPKTPKAVPTPTE